MKKKYLALTLGLVISASTIFAGCASNGTASATTTASSQASGTESTSDISKSSDTVYGKITSVDGKKITVQAGSKSDSGGELTLTDKTKEITVTDDTTYQSEGAGGGTNQGQPPAAPGGNSQGSSGSSSVTLDSLKKGMQVAITLDDDGNAASVTVLSSNSGQGGSGSGQSSSNVSYSGVTEISSDKTLSGKTIDSTGTDEEAVLVTGGAKASLSGLTVSRTSGDSTGGDNSSFYGVGAGILTTEGTTYLSDSTITTDAKGGAGVFSYGENSTSYVSDTTITTKQDTSGGIHTAGGGKLYAYDDTVTTAGESSAAIRSDRGGGTMVVDGGSYTSNGTGSPAVYSTADITIHDADLISNKSEAACIEGSNTIRLFDSDLTGNMPENEQNDCTWNVILYQSMSGDSEEGNSTFEMEGGSLTAKNGGMFYTTNTESTFVLNDVDITYADRNDFFLKCTGNSNARGWGSSGSNGADCSFTAIDQEMEGDVVWDSISQLDFYMTDGSTLKGAVRDDESNAGNGGDGYCNFYISDDSTWTVTGNSTLSKLYNAGTIKDDSGNTVTIKGTDGTVYVKGSSRYTVTVGSYSTKADLSKASSIDSWSSYQVDKPSELS